MGLFGCRTCEALQQQLKEAGDRETRLLDLVQEQSRQLSAHMDARAHVAAMRAQPEAPKDGEALEPPKKKTPIWAYNLMAKRHAADPRLRSGPLRGRA